MESCFLPLTRVSADNNLAWEEDFETGPFDDWTLVGYREINGIYYPSDQFFPSIVNGSLQMINTASPGITSYQIGAFHNSTVAYGNWSFDCVVLTQNVIVGIFFMSNLALNMTGTDGTLPTTNAYYIKIASIREPPEDPALYIWFNKYINGIQTDLKLYTSSNPITGFLHIDITRDHNGTFSVFTNSSSTPIIKVDSNQYMTSKRLVIWSWNGAAIFDNITVNLETTTTTTTTTTSEGPSWDIGLVVFVLPLIILYSRKRR